MKSRLSDLSSLLLYLGTGILMVSSGLGILLPKEVVDQAWGIPVLGLISIVLFILSIVTGFLSKSKRL